MDVILDICSEFNQDIEDEQTGHQNTFVYQSPIEQWIVYKCFQYSHEAVFILPKHFHHIYAGLLVVAVHSSYLSIW